MRLFFFAVLFALLAGCSSGPSIDTSYTATGQGSRVQYIVLHYTAADLPRSLHLLTKTDVSANYLISEKPPTIYQLVDENRRAWHVGVSEWQGRTWLNSTTIGIELVNPGYRETASGRAWVPYNDEQIDTLIVLLKDIMQRHGLKPGSIIAHSDAAPQRKVDPGPLFPWKRLADAGLVPWPDANQVQLTQQKMAGTVPSASWFQQQLQRQGYTVEPTGEFDKSTRNVIAAFQMKYRPARYDGAPDTETAARLLVLNSKR